MVFIDLKKVYDKVPRNVVWWALEKHKVPTKSLPSSRICTRMCMIFVRICDGDTTNFPINIDLHHESALSPYLFALVMYEVTRDIQSDIPCCMLFADDVLLVDESMARVNRKLSCGEAR